MLHDARKSALGKLQRGVHGAIECPVRAAISTGRRNTLIFSQRWSDEHEVTPPRIFYGQAEVRDLGPMATRRVDELDWSGV